MASDAVVKGVECECSCGSLKRSGNSVELKRCGRGAASPLIPFKIDEGRYSVPSVQFCCSQRWGISDSRLLLEGS